MPILVNPHANIEKMLEKAENELLNRTVVINPKTVAWYSTPIKESDIILTITFVGPPVQIPHRYLKEFGDKIVPRLKGVVNNEGSWDHKHEFEFWTVEDFSEVEVVGI